MASARRCSPINCAILEGDGVLARTIHPEVPPRVDYTLTRLGRDLLPVLDGLHAWGEQASRSGDDSSSA